jgi:hypothetical protein
VPYRPTKTYTTWFLKTFIFEAFDIATSKKLASNLNGYGSFLEPVKIGKIENLLQIAKLSEIERPLSRRQAVQK